MTNQKLNEKENEKILDRIAQIKEDIWEYKEYINSDYCKKCSEIYQKISILEKELKSLTEK
jgi:hypothetical protein